MTTMTFISMIVALILVIVAIARVQGSPKLGINLILTLAFAIVVGFGIQSKTRNIEPKKDQIEKVSVVNYMPIQALQIVGVIPMITATIESVSKAYMWFIRDQGDQQHAPPPVIFRPPRPCPWAARRRSHGQCPPSGQWPWP